MAIVFEDALKKSVSEKLLPVYIFFGEDGWLKKNYTDKIIKKITDPDDVFNFAKFGADCELQEVYDFAMQLPMMADKKCVILSDYDFEGCSKNDFDRLIELLSDMPDTSVFILEFDTVEFDSKKSAKFKKLVAAAEKSGGIAVKLDHRRLPELVKMLSDGAQKRGCRMDGTVAKYLIETAGDDINTLKNELDKLCAFVGSGVIDKKTVDSVSVKTVEASVYNLSKYIFDCNVTEALNLLDELFFMRIEPMIILHTISSVYVDMYRVYTAKKSGAKIPEISSAFGYKNREFILDKAAQNLRKFDFNKLKLSLDTLIGADSALKSFRADNKLILEQLIIRLIYIIVKGEKVD